jgi:hypothetical protein
VICHPGMGYVNILAIAYTLLTQDYAVTHPSLPSYIAMISGDAYGIIDDFENCFIDRVSLPDLIEASGHTRKTYQESMPTPCFIGNALLCHQKHNPFIYLDAIRLDDNRCASSIVPLTKLDEDIASSSLSNFVFIAPNACHSSHDCPLDLADAWLHSMMDKLVPALDSNGESYLIILLPGMKARDSIHVVDCLN